MKRLILLTVASLLAACSSAPKPGTLDYAVQASQQRHEAEKAAVKTVASEVPDWYVNPPKDEHALYAAGTANSTDLEFAIDKAILSAKRSLADRVNGSVSSQHKEYLQEGAGGARPTLVSDRTTINKVTDVVLTGYTVVQTKLVPSDTQYRAFVLLQYPLAGLAAAAPKQAEHQAADDTKAKAAKAYDDLQKDIDAAKVRNDVSTGDAPPLP
jgi:hypothetical protein